MENLPKPEQQEFLTAAESELMTHDRWTPKGVRRVPIRFGQGVRGNLFFKEGQAEKMPVVIWLHPLSYHSGYNEGYGVQGTTVYHRMAENGFAVIAYDQCGFGLRLRRKCLLRAASALVPPRPNGDGRSGRGELRCRGEGRHERGDP